MKLSFEIKSWLRHFVSYAKKKTIQLWNRVTFIFAGIKDILQIWNWMKYAQVYMLKMWRNFCLIFSNQHIWEWQFFINSSFSVAGIISKIRWKTFNSKCLKYEGNFVWDLPNHHTYENDKSNRIFPFWDACIITTLKIGFSHFYQVNFKIFIFVCLNKIVNSHCCLSECEVSCLFSSWVLSINLL